MSPSKGSPLSGYWATLVLNLSGANQINSVCSISSIVRSGDAIYVRVGDYDLTRKYGSPGAQTLRVATTYIHHNHNSQTLDNDIALLKLNGQAELREGVCLVCLPARGVSHAAGKRCTVTGYGYMVICVHLDFDTHIFLCFSHIFFKLSNSFCMFSIIFASFERILLRQCRASPDRFRYASVRPNCQSSATPSAFEK